MSRATSIASMAQQLSVSFGVGIAALFLHLTMTFRGETSLTAGDFPYTFFAVAVLSFASLIMFRSLTPEAGAAVSGHHLVPRP